MAINSTRFQVETAEDGKQVLLVAGDWTVWTVTDVEEKLRNTKIASDAILMASARKLLTEAEQRTAEASERMQALRVPFGLVVSQADLPDDPHARRLISPSPSTADGGPNTLASATCCWGVMSCGRT